MGVPGRIQGWWEGLTTAWRVNVGLYALATVCLVALVAEIVAGGQRSPRVEVASQAPRRPTTTLGAVTTIVGPTTTVGVGPTTTGAPVGPLATQAAPSPATTRFRGSASPPPIGFNPAPLDTRAACRNSSDPACGPFAWDPPPGENQPLSVEVTAEPTTVQAGQQVNFTVTVSDPDHPVSDNCAEVDYGDSPGQSLPCSPAPCPRAFGPWTPPVQESGRQEFPFSHTYTEPGQYTATFTFRTDRDRCPNLDPYGSPDRQGSAVITVNPGT